MNTPALRLQQLSLSYGPHTVLQPTSLDIPSGAVVGLVGRNGAGKSSLLRCWAGLTPPSSGQASVLGCDSMDLSDAVRERLGLVSQAPDLLPWLTVWQHIEYIGSFYARWTAERAHQLCQRLALSETTKVSALSGGDQQKLEIVLALAHDPDVLLLDEPVSNLDPLARRDFMRLLFEWDTERAAPRTVVISSHLLSDLERVITHLVMLKDGQVVINAPWDEVQEQRHQALEDLFVSEAQA
ncbi:ABC transporter ATP-binding protein [Ideonella paludis]|uniref:ABC transporter ATP-binding protein n=1 Tax=Ideonella paludis TaxID=1233411 RepID=A0ABS5DZJ8_9BURK|nr:ABC transporter ATP-binding protein [Ideonella paludis]MBQ0936582.1 ABC transporter ATP-binding protein [Ideonella paludis]